jgi:4-hydroxybenzoate polyprenyltransferase
MAEQVVRAAADLKSCMTDPALHHPLVVDLDGTLIKSDLLFETATSLVVRRPLAAFYLFGWLMRGKPELKARLAGAVTVDVATLPYNQELVAWLREQKAQGRRLVLATAANQSLAVKVAAHLALFDHVIASDRTTNLKSVAKRDALVALYGAGGYDYVGNDSADLTVWRDARTAHVVSNSARLYAQAGANGNLGQTIHSGVPSAAQALMRAVRPHQWLKNLLVFIPLVAAHQYGSVGSVLQASLAFLAFGLAASSVYLLNDLVDVESDRHHPRKRFRPFAAGDLSLVHGWIAWPLLLVSACAIAFALLPPTFTHFLLLYAGVSTAYSLRLKQIPIVDVLTLAGLYTLRIIAGAAAIAVPLSFWLLSFSMFFFVSLAFMKRYSELKVARDGHHAIALRGRGYAPQDLELVAMLGSSAGHVAVLVLALYIQDSRTASLYAEPRFIWLACPVMLYWVSRAWLLTHRGQMNEDPILFALRDRVSWMAVGALALIFMLAMVVS